MTSRSILKRIIAKGGMVGQGAAFWIDDPQKAPRYILECADYCGSAMAQKLWGDKLIKAILDFRVSYEFKLQDQPAQAVISVFVKLRKEKRMKQAILAELLNVSLSTMSRIENGTRPLTLNDTRKLSRLFGLTISEIFEKAAQLNRR